MEAIEDDRFAHELANARSKGDMDGFSRVLSGRLRQMDKRARAANVRADRLEAQIAAIRAELPESLRDGEVQHGVASLRIAHEAHDDGFWSHGFALRAALRFVDFAAGEGLKFVPEDGSPNMDAADVCAEIACLLRIDLGGPAWLELIKPLGSSQPTRQESKGEDRG